VVGGGRGIHEDGGSRFCKHRRFGAGAKASEGSNIAKPSARVLPSTPNSSMGKSTRVQINPEAVELAHTLPRVQESPPCVSNSRVRIAPIPSQVVVRASRRSWCRYLLATVPQSITALVVYSLLVAAVLVREAPLPTPPCEPSSSQEEASFLMLTCSGPFDSRGDADRDCTSHCQLALKNERCKVHHLDNSVLTLSETKRIAAFPAVVSEPRIVSPYISIADTLPEVVSFAAVKWVACRMKSRNPQ